MNLRIEKLVFSGLLLSAVATVSAAAASVTVTSNPLWTDTGVTLTVSDVVTIHDASGSWTVFDGQWPWTGPEGAHVPGYEFDEWITNSHHGQLIGFIGPDGLDPNALPRLVPQGDPRLFEISTNSVTLAGRSGRLWLGFNDDWSSGPSINSGSVVAQVDLQRGIQLTIQVSSVDLCWNSPTNFIYQLQYRSALTTNNWVNFGAPIPGNGTNTCVTDSVQGSEKRFYRVETSLAP